MKCSKALRLISYVIDGQATEHQRRLLDFHLMGCGSCRRAYRMSSDISRLTRDLPAPLPPENLEADVMRMIGAPQVPQNRKRLFRTSIFAVPAAVALIVLAVSVSPITPPGENSSQTRISLSSDIPVTPKGLSASRSTPKSRVRTVPLSAYSRQANLISF